MRNIKKKRGNLFYFTEKNTSNLKLRGKYEVKHHPGCLFYLFFSHFLDITNISCISKTIHILGDDPHMKVSPFDHGIQ